MRMRNEQSQFQFANSLAIEPDVMLAQAASIVTTLERMPYLEVSTRTI